MRAADARRLALRHVPGRGAVQLRRIGVGLASATYRVDRDGVSYSLRVADTEARGALDARWEAAVRELAGRAGFAPAVRGAAPEEGVLVSEWVEGRCWDGADAGAPDRIAAIAGLMRGIHALEPPRPQRAVAPAEWIGAYERAIGRRGPRFAADAGALRGAARRRFDVLERADGAARVLCHSDLHPLNVVETGTGLIALDWEYAHVADPLWDPAGWSCMNDFAQPERDALLSCYLGRPPTAGDSERFAALAWLYDYTCLLWSEAFAIREPAAVDAPFVARARRLAARLGGE